MPEFEFKESFKKYPNGAGKDGKVYVRDIGVDEFNAFCISGKGGEQFYVWTEDSLSLQEREKVIENINQIPGNFDLNSTNVSFYSNALGEDTLVNEGITIRGEIVKYYKEDGYIQFGNSNQWTMIAFACYNKESALGADIDIVNTYTPSTIDFAIKKILDGATDPQLLNKVAFNLLKYDEEFGGYRLYKENVAANESSSLVDKDAVGYAIFSGIPSGQYLLEEVKTADGYNLVNPIEIWVGEEDGILIVKVKVGNEWKPMDSADIEESKNIPVYEVINYPGAELPKSDRSHVVL